MEPPQPIADTVPPTGGPRFVSWTDLERVADEAADIDAIVRKELESLGQQGRLGETAAFEGRDAPRSGRRGRRRVGIVVICIVAFSVVAGALAAVVIPRIQSGRSPVREPSLTSPSPADVAPSVQPSQPQQAASVVKLIRARLFVSAPCWVRAVADGQVVFKATLPGGVRTFQARHSLLLTLGNAGGVRLVVNGRTVATGSAGEVVDLSFALKHGELVRSSDRS